MSLNSIRDRVHQLLEPVVHGAGLDLEELTLAQAGRRRVLRIFVERDGGISLDDVAEVTRAVSKALDATSVMGENEYVLEVGSPGVDRPLTLPRHWRRALGRLVAVRTVGGGELTGRVREAGEENAVLDADGAQHLVVFTEVAVARVQVEFGRARERGGDREDTDVAADGFEDGLGDEGGE